MRLLPGKRIVQLASGQRVEYDLLSLAVGSLPLGGQRPEVSRHAVRQGPVLWESLKAAAEGTSPPCYRPQPSFLSILNTADGKALLRYKTLVSHSVWAWQLKDWIDRRFARKYQDLTELRTIRNLP